MATQENSESTTGLTESAGQSVTAATAAVQDSIASLPDVIGRYPWSSLLIGVGLGYLLMPRRSAGWRAPSRSRPLGQAWSAAQDTLAQAGQGLGENVAETASGLADQAQALAAGVTQQAREATTALGQRLGPVMDESWEALPAVATRYPVATLLLVAGLSYWVGTTRNRR
jgi:hypothetical protein